MPVFDKSTKVGRKVKDPSSDKTLPSGKALSYGAMTSAGGLAGATGIDCKLVHGDRYQVIDAKMTETIAADEQTTIGGNENHLVGQTRATMIGQNETIIIGGNEMVTVVGTLNILQIGAKNDVTVGPVSRLNSSPDNQAEPTNKMRVFGIEFKICESEASFTPAKLEVVGASVASTQFKFEVTTMGIDVKGIDVAGAILSAESKTIKMELEALKSYTFGGEVKLAAADAAVVPSINAVPHIPTAGGT